jgi:signal transduction histidine kinase
MIAPAGTRSRMVWLVVAFFTADGLLHFGYRYLDYVARGVDVSPFVPFAEEVSGSWATVPIFPVIVWLVGALPLGRATWLRRLPAYLAVMTAASFVHTSLMWGARELVWRAVYGRSYDYGDMHVRYFMEFANDVVWFWLFVAVIMGFFAYRAARARELREAELEAGLARAEVESLERRLHPHFLFNALNTISQVMYEDPAAADRMLSGLSDLLRRALAAGGAQEVPLADELALLDRYLDIMRARFSDRLAVDVDIDDEARGALVPPLLLQPLVENAIRHGVDPATHRVDAALSARREGSALRLTVRDRGPGIADAAGARRGVGLSTTERRLSALYGADQRLSLRNAEGGGLAVTIELPFRTAEERRDARAAG